MVNKTIKDIQWSFLSILSISITYFTLRIILARELGAYSLGVYTLLFSIYTLSTQFAGFGIGASLTKFVPESIENAHKTCMLLTSGCIVSLVSGLLTSIVLFVSSNFFANLFNMPELSELLSILSLIFPFLALQRTVLGFINGAQQMFQFALINLAQNLLILFMTIIFITSGYGLIGATISLVLPIIISSFISIFLVRKYFIKINLIRCVDITKKLSAFGCFVVLAISIETLHMNIDNIMIGYLLDASNLGYYSISITLSQALFLVPRAVQIITNPKISLLYNKSNLDALTILVNRTMKYTFLFLIPISFILWFEAENMIMLVFGEEFIQASMPFRILLIGFIIFAIQISIGTTLSSTAYVNLVFKLSFISAITNLMLNYILIPQFGIAGSAISTSSSMVLAVMLQLYFIERLVKVKIDWNWFLHATILVISIVILTHILLLLFHLTVVVYISFLILSILLVILFINKEDKEVIRRSIFNN